MFLENAAIYQSTRGVLKLASTCFEGVLEENASKSQLDFQISPYWMEYVRQQPSTRAAQLARYTSTYRSDCLFLKEEWGGWMVCIALEIT